MFAELDRGRQMSQPRPKCPTCHKRVLGSHVCAPPPRQEPPNLTDFCAAIRDPTTGERCGRDLREDAERRTVTYPGQEPIHICGRCPIPDYNGPPISTYSKPADELSIIQGERWDRDYCVVSYDIFR
jgi:hypothetical protein